MTETTPEQVEAMRELCVQLEAHPLVDSALVDDWGRFGNFQILIVPQEPAPSTTVRLKALVKKTLPAGARLRTCFNPDPVYGRNSSGTSRKVIGYERDYWVFDIDYQLYDRHTNSFSQP